MKCEEMVWIKYNVLFQDSNVYFVMFHFFFVCVFLFFILIYIFLMLFIFSFDQSLYKNTNEEILRIKWVYFLHIVWHFIYIYEYVYVYSIGLWGFVLFLMLKCELQLRHKFTQLIVFFILHLHIAHMYIFHNFRRYSHLIRCCYCCACFHCCYLLLYLRFCFSILVCVIQKTMKIVTINKVLRDFFNAFHGAWDYVCIHYICTSINIYIRIVLLIKFFFLL